MKKFEVLYPRWYGENWCASKTVRANDHEQAAEVWAELSDQEGDYDIISRGETEDPVLVREEGSEEIKKFKVRAEQTINYSARELE